MKKNRGLSAKDLAELILVVVMLWVAADFLSEAITKFWQPDLVGSILIFVAVILFSWFLLGDHIKEAF